MNSRSSYWLVVCLLFSGCGTLGVDSPQALSEPAIAASTSNPGRSGASRLDLTSGVSVFPAQRMPEPTRVRTQSVCAVQIPLDQQVGQLMIPLMTQSEFVRAGKWVAQGLIGGVVVLGSPDGTVRNDIADFQQRSLLGPAIIAVDEEGGRVQRLSALTSRVPSARQVATSLSAKAARGLAEQHAIAIGELGFTMNLAPVADLNISGAIGDRSFGNEASSVTTYAMATADGILDAGLVPVLKHFPGHGRGSDSHVGLPVLPGVQVLRDTDLVPFIEAASRQDIAIMMGHLVVDGLTAGQPASLSRAAVDGLLRQELGFEGLVITDAFNMEAIAATMDDADAAEMALAAGVDLVMLSSLAAAPMAVQRVVGAVLADRITQQSITESFLRVMRTRGIDVCEWASASPLAHR